MLKTVEKHSVQYYGYDAVSYRFTLRAYLSYNSHKRSVLTPQSSCESKGTHNRDDVMLAIIIMGHVRKQAHACLYQTQIYET